MAPNKPGFRWTPEEEAWLPVHVIDDAGRSKKNGTQAQWQKSIIADFEKTFPFLPRSQVNGAVETEGELMQRWNANPRRIRRWIGNHQESILRRHAENRPQNLHKRLAQKPTKQIRSKNARDMAKAHHPPLKAKWLDLHKQFKDGKISKSERLTEYNKAVTVLLEDERWKTYYTAMENGQEPTQGPSASASTETNAYRVFTLSELQIIQSIPSLSVSMTAEANAIRVQNNEPEAHWEHEPQDNSYLGVQQENPNTGESALFQPYPPPGPAPRDDVEPMIIDSRCLEPPASDGVLSRVVASSDMAPEPTSYTLQQTTFDDTSLQFIGMDADTYCNDSSYVTDISEWAAQYATPRTVEAFQLNQTSSNLTNRYPFNASSSSLAHALDYHHHPAQPFYVQPSAYTALPLPEVPVNSYADQNDPPHTIESHKSSSTDNRSTSSNAANAARDRYKDWSPAGDWHLQKVFGGHTNWADCLAFSHNGKLLASGSDNCTIVVWSVETGEVLLGPLKGHIDWVFSLAFSPDDLRIVSGSMDCTVRIWSAKTGKQLHKLEAHTTTIFSVAFSSDGSRVASSDRDHGILIWEVDSKRCIRWLESPGHWGFNLCFSADDRSIAAIYRHQLRILDVESGVERVPTSPQAASFDDLVWFEDRTLYTYTDGEINPWSDEEASILNWRSTLSPDRKWISTSGSRGIYLYSRSPPPEEDIEDICRRFTLVEGDLKTDTQSESESDTESANSEYNA